MKKPLKQKLEKQVFFFLLVYFKGKHVIFQMARAFFDFLNLRRILLFFHKSSFLAFKTQKFEKIYKISFKIWSILCKKDTMFWIFSKRIGYHKKCHTNFETRRPEIGPTNSPDLVPLYYAIWPMILAAACKERAASVP